MSPSERRRRFSELRLNREVKTSCRRAAAKVKSDDSADVLVSSSDDEFSFLPRVSVIDAEDVPWEVSPVAAESTVTPSRRLRDLVDLLEDGSISFSPKSHIGARAILGVLNGELSKSFRRVMLRQASAAAGRAAVLTKAIAASTISKSLLILSRIHIPEMRYAFSRITDNSCSQVSQLRHLMGFMQLVHVIEKQEMRVCGNVFRHLNN